MYINQKLSKKKIGDIYGCGATTIDRRLIEYNIPARTTPNYKISYKLDKEKVLDMFINQGKSILSISKELSVGMSGIRYLLKREGMNTTINKNRSQLDKNKLKIRFDELLKLGIRKMKIYEQLSKEFDLSKAYVSKLKF